MNEFTFDLQRFAEFELEAGGSSVTINGNNWARGIAVTTGTETKNYTLNVSDGGVAIVSADADGTVRIQVTRGYARDFLDTETNKGANFIFTSGTFRNCFSSRPITLGEGGPTFENVESGTSFAPVDIVLTPYTGYSTVTMTCTEVNETIRNFTVAGLTYTPAQGTSGALATLSMKIQDGKTYIDSATNNTATITYNDGTTTRTYTKISGTATFAFDNDGSNAYVTDMDNGESFKLGDVTCLLSNSRLAITDDETIKFWNQGVVDSTTLIPLSSLNFDSANFSSTDSLIDGVDYYTVLNPGLASLLTDNTAASQITDMPDIATGVAIGVSDTQITMGVPEKYSPSTVAQILLDIAPPFPSPQTLYIYFPYAPTTFYFKVAMMSNGSLVVDTYNGSTQLDTTGLINLTTYGVDLTAPLRLMLQAQFARTNSGKTFVTLNVGSYTRKQQLPTNVIFDSSNCSYRFVGATSSMIYISNIIARDEAIGKLTERIVPLPVSTTDTDMTESNGLYTAGAVGESILQTPDVDDLVQTYGASSVVTGILVVGNPAYLSSTGDGLTNLTCIDKTNNVVTEHKTFELDTNSTKAIADNWRPANTRLNNLAGMQLGWKAGAQS